MEIIKIQPQGYCNGVKRAIEIAIDSAKNPKIAKPIYILGMLIHNSKVNEYLTSLGIITINNGKTRMEMLDDIEEGTVIISAHGASTSLFRKATSLGLGVINATCPIVTKIHRDVKVALEQNKTILYIGNKHHPEAEGVLGEGDNIIPIEKVSDLIMLDKHKEYYVVNQTTLSLLDIKEYHEYINNNFEKAKIDNDICYATTSRQEALLSSSGDLLIVVGDPRSSNTQKLLEVGQKSKRYRECIKVEDMFGLMNFNFSGINRVCITSGASTPDKVVDDIITMLSHF